MTRQERAELSPDELERQTGEALPDREVMSTIDLGDASMTTLPMPVDSTPTDEQTYPTGPPLEKWRPPAF